MHVDETKAEGLTREFAVTVPAEDIESKVSDRLAEVGKTVKMPGFRPGKVPLQVLRKRFGPQVIGEVLEEAISQATADAIRERELRPAMQPKIRIESFDEGKDLQFTINLELMPEIEPVDYGSIKVERQTVDVTDEMVDEALKRIAEQQKAYAPIEEDRPAKAEDAVLVDFTGRVDGEEFPGGSAKDFELQLDSEGFIPGFIEQLQGVKKGETRTIKVTFPSDYGAEALAGKEAEFDVTVKEVRERKPVEVTEELAKAAGMESLDAMKAAVRERMASEYESISRMQVKRALLDKLADRISFDPPPALVESEFQQIWASLTGEPVPQEGHDHHDHDHDHDHDHAASQGDPAARARFQQMKEESGKTEDELREEYRGIAERRVKLGILLSETGRENNISVSDEELNRALANEARRFPGQERQVIEFYKNDQAALEQLRAPLFEDKVIDFVLELADVSEKKVTPDELMNTGQDDGDSGAADEEESGATKKKPAAKPKAAKSAAKSSDSKTGTPKATGPAKRKAPAKKASTDKKPAKDEPASKD